MPMLRRLIAAQYRQRISNMRELVLEEIEQVSGGFISPAGAFAAFSFGLGFGYTVAWNFFTRG